MCVAHGVQRATSPQRVDIKSSQTLAQGAVAIVGSGSTPPSSFTTAKATPSSRGVNSLARRLRRTLTRRLASETSSLPSLQSARARLAERLRVRDRGWDAGIDAATLAGLVASRDAAGDMAVAAGGLMAPTAGEPVPATSVPAASRDDAAVIAG